MGNSIQGHACKDVVWEWVGKAMKENPQVLIQKLIVIAEHSFVHLFKFLIDQS